MKSKKIIKKNARQILKKNYLKLIAVVFFIFLTTNNFSPITSTNINLESISSFSPRLNISNNVNIALETLSKVTDFKIDLKTYQPTRGVLASLFNNVTASGSFIFGFLNSFNQLFFHGHIWSSIIILIGAIITFLYWFFIRNVLIVGEKRFFLENYKHPKTLFKRIFLPFKVKATKNTSLAIFRKTIYEWLWFLTIIGGIIKHYEYIFVPYILAENPEIKGKEAIKLSKEMTYKNKWNLFKFDVSFIGWEILNIFTFNILKITFINPYKECCMTEIYMDLREKAKNDKIKNYLLLCDEYLTEESDYYPADKYMYPEKTTKKIITTDYQKDYSITSLILMFFTASCFGWFWEVGLHLFQYGSLVNRGTLYGPWIPIYGWGTVSLLIILKKVRNKPILTFFLSLLICGIIEYACGWYLEETKNARYWDYDGFFLNLHGRICLEGLIAFGVGGCAFIYYAAPVLEGIYIKLKSKLKIILCIILVIFYVGDTVYSTIYPHTGDGISENMTET